MNGKKFKYVIIDDLYPRVCSEANQHRDLVRGGEKVTSAGFAKLSFQSSDDYNDEQFEVSCYGESIGLNVQSIPDHDSIILGRMFGPEF